MKTALAILALLASSAASAKPKLDSCAPESQGALHSLTQDLASIAGIRAISVWPAGEEWTGKGNWPAPEYFEMAPSPLWRELLKDERLRRFKGTREAILSVDSYSRNADGTFDFAVSVPAGQGDRRSGIVTVMRVSVKGALAQWERGPGNAKAILPLPLMIDTVQGTGFPIAMIGDGSGEADLHAIAKALHIPLKRKHKYAIQEIEVRDVDVDVYGTIFVRAWVTHEDQPTEVVRQKITHAELLAAAKNNEGFATIAAALKPAFGK